MKSKKFLSLLVSLSILGTSLFSFAPNVQAASVKNSSPVKSLNSTTLKPLNAADILSSTQTITFDCGLTIDMDATFTRSPVDNTYVYTSYSATVINRPSGISYSIRRNDYSTNASEFVITANGKNYNETQTWVAGCGQIGDLYWFEEY